MLECFELKISILDNLLVNIIVIVGIGQLVSPVISGIVMSHYGVSHVIAIDLCTCMFAILSLLVVTFPYTSSYQKELSGNFQ